MESMHSSAERKLHRLKCEESVFYKEMRCLARDRIAVDGLEIALVSGESEVFHRLQIRCDRYLNCMFFRLMKIDEIVKSRHPVEERGPASP